MKTEQTSKPKGRPAKSEFDKLSPALQRAIKMARGLKESDKLSKEDYKLYKEMAARVNVPDSVFEPDYAASKKDLEHLATKLDIAQLKGELAGGFDVDINRLEIGIKDLEIRMLNTMASKTEMRMLIGGLYLLITVGFLALTFVGK